MRTLTLGAVAAATALTGLTGCTELGDRPGYASDYSNYDYNRPDPQYQGYYADQYYVDNSRYTERQLNSNDRVYVGRDGRYYCRRSDGTTGLIVGGIAGGALGAVLTSGKSEMLGILLGAAAGAAVGTTVDKNAAKNNVRCK